MQTIMKEIFTSDQLVSECARELGRKGGSRITPAKSEASRRNAAKATVVRRYKAAERRMSKAREDVQARPRRIEVPAYEQELARYRKLYDQYMKAMSN